MITPYNHYSECINVYNVAKANMADNSIYFTLELNNIVLSIDPKFKEVFKYHLDI